MIFKQETIKSWFTGINSSINSEVIKPFQNAEQVIWKYNQAIEHNSLTQNGWNRILAQSDDSLKMYLTSIKGTTASMTGYTTSLQGNIVGFRKVSSAITQYNSIASTGTANQTTFANAVSATNAKLGTYLVGLNGAKASIGGYALSLVGATAKTIALQFATIALNSAITMGASLIISGIVSAISEWIHKTENMISASEDAIEKIKSINDELKNNQKTISETAKRYAELAQGVNQLTGENNSLSNEDYEEFLSLSNQLAEMFPTLTRNYNDNGDAIVQLSGDVDTIVGSLQNLIEAQRDLANRQIVDELPTVFDGVATKSDKYEQQLADLESRRDTLIKSLGDVQSEEFSSNFMDGFSNRWIEISGDNLEVISQMRDDYMKILKEANIDFEELTPTYEIKDGIEVPVGFTIKINSSDEDIEKAENTIDGKIQELASQYETDINKLNEEINTTNEKNKANWTSLSSSIFAWLSTDDSFKVMDDTMQATVQNIVNSLDWGSLDFSSWEDAKQYIQENILSLFNTPEGKGTLEDIEVMFGIQTQFNNGDISVNDYQDKIQELLANIEGLPDETKKSIMWLFGINFEEDGTTSSDTDTLINNVKEKLQDDFDDKVGELTLDELKIAAEQVEVPDGTLLSWDELIAKIKEAKQAKMELSSFSDQLTTSKDAFDKFQSSVQSAKDAYTTLLSGNYSSSELLDSIQTINQVVSDMGGSLNWEFINSQTNSLELLGDAIQHISQKYAESILSGAGIDMNSEFGQMLANMVTQAFEAEAAFEGMNSQLDSLQSSYQTLTGILESYNETGYISLDNLQSLLTADENLIAMLEVENGQLVLNQAAYENLVAVQLLEFKAKLNDAAAAEIETLAKQRAEQATNQNADASQNAVEKLDAETAAFNRNTTAAIANAVEKAEESGVSEDEIQGIFDKYTEVWNSAMNNYSGDFDGFMGGTKSAGSAGSSAGDAYVDAFEKELEKLQTLRDQGKITEKEYLDYLRKLYQKFFKDKKKYAEQYAKYEHEYLQGMKSLYESALSGITSLLDKQISGFEDSKSAAVDALEAERDARIEVIEAEKEQYEEQIKLIDKQIEEKEKVIDSINDEIDAIRDANEERQRQINLQKAQYELERMQNQRTILQYSSDKGMHYVTDTSGVRDAKNELDNTQTEIEIANKEKEIKLIEKEIDLLEERKDAINEQIDLLDEQIDQINKQYDKMIADTEKYWDSIIKGMEDYKSRWEELAEVEEQAKLISMLEQLGITTDDVLGMSEEAFAKFKDEYIGILADIYSGNDSMLSALSDTTGQSVNQLGSYLEVTQGYIDGLSGIGESLDPVVKAIGDVDENMDSLSSTASEANTNLSETATSVGEVSTNVSGLETNLTSINSLVSEEQTAFDNLKTKINEVVEAINQKTEAIQEEQNAVGIATSSEMADFLLLKEKILEIKETLESFGTQDEGLISNIVLAIQSLNEISLEEGIVAQFNNLKTAIDSVASAISGGGGESSGSESQSGSSGSGKSGESGGKDSQSSGGGNSLTGAIESMGETATITIGEPDAEGDGTVIGEFGSLETAVNDVTTAIGGGDSEGGESSDSSGDKNDSNLIDSIVNLGETTQETLGEPGGDGAIGKFEQFKEPIAEADEHVHGISTGLNEIDGKTVECTIKIKVESDGFPAYASGTALGSMNLNSAEYNAKYEGSAHVSGTANVTGNWGVRTPGRSLVGELGQELWVHSKDGTFETVGDNGAEFINTEAEDLIFNHLQTRELLSKGNIVKHGRAYANGTIQYSDGTVIRPNGDVLRPLQEGDRGWDLMKAFEPLVKRIQNGQEELVTNAMFEGQRQFEKWTKEITNNTAINNIVNNRNMQPVVNHINVTCPGVTSQQVAEQLGSVLGKELDKQFNGFHNYVDQQSRIR